MLTDLVDLADEGMVEVRGGAALPGGGARSAPSFKARQKEFQRDFAIEREILCQVHFAHAPVSKTGEDPVVGNLIWDHRGKRQAILCAASGQRKRQPGHSP